MSDPSSHRLRTLSSPLALVALAALISAVALLPRAAAAPGWELILDRPTPNFGGIDFVSDSEGWMTAGAGLLHTTDGGATWTEGARLTATDVNFADADHGWLVGSGGRIYATTDGGETWSLQTSDTQVHLHQVIAKSAHEAWVLGTGQGYSDVIVFPAPTVLLHTTDGGTAWQSVVLPPNTEFREMVFVGPNGWLLGSGCTPPPDSTYCGGSVSPVLLRTTDSGATWGLQQIELPDIVHSLTFADATHGWLSASACSAPDKCTIGVYRTTDGGAMWTQGELGVTGFVGPTVFRDAMTGWVAVRDCNVAFICSTGLPPTHILRTDDGGVSWRQAGSLDLPSPMQTANTLAFYGSILYLTGSGVAYRSSDEGTTWERMEHPAVAFDSKVDFIDRSVGYAISRGELLRSDDAGRNWHSVGLIPDGAQSSLSFITEKLGFTSSRSCIANGQCTNTLLRTTDGGTRWQPVLALNSEDAYFGDVLPVDERRGYAGLSTAVAVTNDGGLTWEQRSPPDGWRIPTLAVADAENLWAIFATITYPTTYGLRHSPDGGRTWQAALTLPGYADNLTFADKGHGWYLDYTCADQCVAKLHATTDGGATWHEQDPGARAVNDLLFVDRLNGWANATSPSLGYGEALLHTADGGETWTAQITGDFVVGQLEFVDVATGWLALSPYRGYGTGGGASNRTVLYHTTDGGGGPIGVLPTPTIQLPDVGSGTTDRSADTLPLGLLLAAVAVALGVAGALIARRSAA